MKAHVACAWLLPRGQLCAVLEKVRGGDNCFSGKTRLDTFMNIIEGSRITKSKFLQRNTGVAKDGDGERGSLFPGSHASTSLLCKDTWISSGNCPNKTEYKQWCKCLCV